MEGSVGVALNIIFWKLFYYIVIRVAQIVAIPFIEDIFKIQAVQFRYGVLGIAVHFDRIKCIVSALVKYHSYFASAPLKSFSHKISLFRTHVGIIETLYDKSRCIDLTCTGIRELSVGPELPIVSGKCFLGFVEVSEQLGAQFPERIGTCIKTEESA